MLTAVLVGLLALVAAVAANVLSALWVRATATEMAR